MAKIVAKINLPNADTLGVIKYLIEEIEQEKQYNAAYEREQNSAIAKAKKDGGYWWQYVNSVDFPRPPRKSIINDNAKMVRRLLLKIKEST